MVLDKHTIAELRGIESHFGTSAQVREQLRQVITGVAERCGIHTVESPIVDPRTVFTHAVGDSSDIVKKEMFRVYGVKDDTDWVLRPEATAQIMRTRAHNLQNFGHDRVWYWGPMFRYERPQKGRLRQFTQFGIEFFGNDSVWDDIQILLVGQQLMNLLPVGTAKLEIGSLGSDACRATYRQALVAFLEKHLADICQDCLRRKEVNPLRALDCKNPACKATYANAPSMQDYLSPEMKARQATTLAALDAAGIDYVLNRSLVRGLDYYGGVVFEWTTDQLGAKAAVCAGGRYDNLSLLYGKQVIPAVGFALGVERFAALWQPPTSSTSCLRVIVLPENSASEAPSNVTSQWPQALWDAVEDVRRTGLTVEWDMSDRSLKAQMRKADRDGVHYVAVVGQTEQNAGSCVIKNMRDNSQFEIEFSKLGQWAAGVQNE